MSARRKVLWLVAAFAVVHGVQACSVETDPGAELNPQPLPPEDPSAPDEQRENDDLGGGGGSSSGAPSTGVGDADGGAEDGATDSGEGG